MLKYNITPNEYHKAKELVNRYEAEQTKLKKLSPENILKLTIEEAQVLADIQLSYRTWCNLINHLLEDGFASVTVGDIVKCNPSELKQFRNIGNGCLWELKIFFAKLNIKWGKNDAYIDEYHSNKWK